MTWQQDYAPLGGSIGWSALVAAIPVLVLFVMLGVKRTAAWIAATTALGSAFVMARLTGGPNILFGGDLGRYNRPILPDPSGAIAADVVLVESTYGDRDHQPDDPHQRHVRQ